MKKNTRILLLALLVLSLSNTTSAQYKFVVDALTKEGTSLYPYVTPPTDRWVDLSDPVDTIPNGTEVTVAPADTVVLNATFRSMKKSMFYKKTTYNGDVVVVTYQGSRYFVDAKDLMISPEETACRDFINCHKNHHTAWGRFYSTMTPFVAIFFLLLAATILAFLINGKNGPRLIPTILVPACILTAILLEMLGVIKMGRDVLWWLDVDVIDKGTVILRLVIFALAVIMQIFSMRLYKNGIVSFVRDHEQKIHVKRPMVGALIGVILLAASVIAAIIVPKQAEICLTVGGILLVVAIIVAIISTAVVNCRALGKGAGIAFTLFVVIYGIGLITTLIMLVIGIVNVFMEMLITIVGGTAVLMMMSKVVPSRSYTENGVRYEVYEDFNPFKK